ncbi:DNA cytosine methyltransferase [Halodesulfovibrio aestuarii]|uniref:DNA (cytosine-5-)-methyltransferase n=1 Tax=Halodesulfovibrio aestuarii TaxID=126333 RepID=A0ABV4JQM3_9BACT
MRGLIIDLFAGGGGASTGCEMATGRSPDIAINHDMCAVAMHKENHPDTLHYCQNICDVQPTHVVKGRPVELLWASPDCTHFSKAKGGKPRDQKIRDLAWTIVKWAEQVRPKIICLENVEEFQTWGALDKNGQPIESEKGATFRAWKRALRRAGYKIEHKELRACDYGAPTIRKRFFLVARCDGQKINWPKATHGEGLLPYRTAAECIDWNEPACSIFATKPEAITWAKEHGKGIPKRPLAEKTMCRVARGVQKFVINDPDPFIVNSHTPFIQHVQHSSAVNGVMAADEPMRTITATPKGGGMALVAPVINTYYGAKTKNDFRGCKLDGLLGTQTTENRHALVTAFLAKHYGGVTGTSVDKPTGTVTTVDHHAVVSAFLSRQFGQSVGQRSDKATPTIMPNGGGKTALTLGYMQKMRGTNIGSKLETPLHTVSAGGLHHALTIAHMISFYGSETEPVTLEKPMRTVVTKDRFGLVVVDVQGEPHVMTDIAMRMLTPRELYRAQGFPETYIIDQAAGKKLSKTQQVKMCGNSVPPPLAASLIKANYSTLTEDQEQRTALPLLEVA